MLRTGDRFENRTTGDVLEIVHAPDDGDRALLVRRVLRPGDGKTIAHIHRDYVERFVVESERAVGRFDGRRIELDPGDELEVPIGVSHVNPYGTGTEKLVIRVSFEPASAFILGYAETLGHMTAADTSDKHGEVPVPDAIQRGPCSRWARCSAGCGDTSSTCRHNGLPRANARNPTSLRFSPSPTSGSTST